MTPSNDTKGADIKHSLIVDEAIRFMYSNLGGISVLQLFFPISVAWMYWSNISHTLILVWVLAVISVYVTRIVLARKFTTSTIEDGQYPLWAGYFTWTSLASGLLWGLASILFYSPESVNLQVLLYVLIVAVAAGSLIVTCYWLPAFFAYSVPAVGLVSLNLLIRADMPGKVLGVLFLLFLLIFAQVSRRTRDLMYHSIRMKFENLALVEELKRAKERAETANRAKTRFLASANHDLRQPVHALSLMTYAAKDELTSARGQKLYDSINRTVRSLSQLLESLLDLSRLDAGAMPIQAENVNLQPLGTQLLTEFLPLAQRKKLRFGLGPFNYSVLTDIALLERVLRNLINNAIRYTNAGGEGGAMAMWHRTAGGKDFMPPVGIYM
jgi:signal transduction histidine kinase